MLPKIKNIDNKNEKLINNTIIISKEYNKIPNILLRISKILFLKELNNSIFFGIK
tara:strand:- start:274 stop:438 length:165 start_codon:yes stop_codon:yes gene_type:complete